MTLNFSSTKIKIIIYTFSLLLILSAISFFAVLPAIQEILIINEQILSERKTLEKKYQQGQSLRKATADYLSIKDEFNTILKAFVVKNEELEFVTQLEALATANQIEQTIKFGAEEEYNQDFENITVELTAQGNYKSLLNYFKALESLPYYLNFNTLRIFQTKKSLVKTGEGVATSDTELKLILNVKVFRKK